MVRAPPCHGGSCGFEPRLPRIFLAHLLFSLVILLTSCSSPSLEDFRSEGEATSRELTAELKQIRSRDDLLIHAPRLQTLFNRLVEIILAAESFKELQDQTTVELSVNRHSAISDQLRIELNRVLHMEGGREVIERAQEAALNRLDAFEQNKRLKSTSH